MTLRMPDAQVSAPLQPLLFDWAQRAGIRLAALRLDLLDPLTGGNKYFKLQGHLQAAQAAGARGLLSLGGAHSNHLHAMAAVCQRVGLASIGLLRGEPQATPTVADLQAFGMQLHWLGYGGYRARQQPGFAREWQQRYPGFQLVAEGGGGLLGAAGFAVIPAMIAQQLSLLGWSDYDACWLAAGTGTSLAGLVLAEAGAHCLYGARVVPAGHGVETQVSQILQQAGMADTGYHLLDASRTGYGRIDRQLAQFIGEIDADGQLPVEACYTGKALLALRSRVEAGYFCAGTRLVFLHTGGLQGRRAQESVLRAQALSPRE